MMFVGVFVVGKHLDTFIRTPLIGLEHGEIMYVYEHNEAGWFRGIVLGKGEIQFQENSMVHKSIILITKNGFRTRLLELFK